MFKKILHKTILTVAIMTIPTLSASFEFTSIEGDPINLDEYKGNAVLIVNTASKCGFTRQLGGIQKLHETYGDDGLIVIAVPSNDFRQELKTGEAVKKYCEINYNLTVPMAEITKVTGKDAHPFYKWAKENHKFTPRWNFYKVLLDKEGNFVQGYSSATKPMSPKITDKIKRILSD